MLHLETFMELKQADLEEKITLVWLGEYYHRVKKLPRLKEEIRKISGQKEMTDDQMFNVVKQLNAQFGGVVKSAKPREGE